jgi:ABC-type Fe3+/spermidine/putrescine transport system ATPase subunit
MLDVVVERDLPSIHIDVELTIADEIVVLFGPSGAGKTLTVKMVAGLERPDRGRVCLAGRTVFDSAAGIDLPPQDRGAGYVPQRSGVFPHLTALENVALPLRRGRQRMAGQAAHARALALLERFGLRERAGARPAQMSGGELQRVAFARVLATQPDALLVDEPFAALDAPVRAELRREFRRFQRELGIPAIFITHDVEEAAVVGDRVAIMIDGRIRQLGLPREILDYPADSAVAYLVRAGNILPGRVLCGGQSGAVETPIGKLAVNTGKFESGAAVTAVVRPEGIRILREDRDTSRLSDASILSGHITEIADHGALIEVTANVGAGTLVVHVSPTAAANLRLEAGRPLRLAIPPERVHLIDHHERD